MKLIDVLRVCDFCGLHIICYINDEDEPAWKGGAINIPYWIADLELNTEDLKPIDYRVDLGEDYNHKPGLIICLKEE